MSALEAYEGLERRRVLRREGGGGGTDPPDVGCILVSFDSPFVGNIKRVRIRERVSITGAIKQLHTRAISLPDDNQRKTQTE